MTTTVPGRPGPAPVGGVVASASGGPGEGRAVQPVRPVTAERAWALFAPAIAGAGQRVRLSRDGGRSYPQRWERALRPECPDVPAAVRLFGPDGRARCLALDFDVSAGGRDRVLADCARAERLVVDCGGVPVVDESVSGGRHLYVLLATPRHLDELRPVLQALSALLPSLDTVPMLNVRAGCLRPPGSAHRAGGSQQLVTPWPVAVQAVRRPAADSVWTALRDRLTTPADQRTHAGQTGQGSQGSACGGGGADGRAGTTGAPGGTGGLRLPPPQLSRLARTGSWEPGSYATPSEARFAVVCSLVARGWPLAELALRMEDGTWPGLRGLYARYQGGWRTALLRDWRKAQTLPACPLPGRPAPGPTTGQATGPVNTKTPSERPGHGSDRNCTTRETAPQRAADRADSLSLAVTGTAVRGYDTTPAVGDPLEYQWIRAWWTCVALSTPELVGRGASAQAAVLTALGNAAQKTGSRVIAFGIRSLELAAGCDHTTVARALRALRDADDPLIDLVQPAHGPDADTYQLRIPDRLASVARTRTWARGPIRAVHPVFRVLGLPAWQTHTALVAAAGSTTELADRTGLSRTATTSALHTLADHGLAASHGRTWTLGPQSLDWVGRHLDTDTLVATIHAGHQADRAAWRDYLTGLHRLHGVHTLADIVTGNQRWSDPPGSDPPWSAPSWNNPPWSDAAPHDPLWREEPPPDPYQSAPAAGTPPSPHVGTEARPPFTPTGATNRPDPRGSDHPVLQLLRDILGATVID